MCLSGWGVSAFDLGHLLPIQWHGKEVFKFAPNSSFHYIRRLLRWRRIGWKLLFGANVKTSFPYHWIGNRWLRSKAEMPRALKHIFLITPSPTYFLENNLVKGKPWLIVFIRCPKRVNDSSPMRRRACGFCSMRGGRLVSPCAATWWQLPRYPIRNCDPGTMHRRNGDNAHTRSRPSADPNRWKPCAFPRFLYLETVALRPWDGPLAAWRPQRCLSEACPGLLLCRFCGFTVVVLSESM
jgi:hypothetical protein